MPKHPAHEEQRQHWLAEELLAPAVREKREPRRAGSLVGSVDEADSMLVSADEWLNRWLRSGAHLDDLARWLQEWPQLSQQPLVLKQLFHLHALATGDMPMAAFWEAGSDKEAAAQEKLKLIAEALVRGLLPGYAVQIAVDAPIGRPRGVDHHELLCDLKGLLGDLEYLLENDPFLLLRKRRESPSGFTRRISKIIQGLYQNSHMSLRVSISPYKPFLDAKGQPAVYDDPRSLDLATAWKIGKCASHRRQSASLKGLVLGILGYHYRITARAVENHLDRAKAQYPDRFRSLLERFPRFGRQG